MTDPAKPTGMGLYADLLADPAKKSSDGSTISGAPVRYSLQPQGSTEPAPKRRDASLQFQPLARRPQPKGKAKTNAAAHAWAMKAATATPAQADTTKPAVQGSNIEYWLEKGNDHNYVRPRHYKDRKSKKKQQQREVYQDNWDDIYDPSQPNHYRAYKGSEERYREIDEWKNRLYLRARRGRTQKSREEPTYAVNPLFAPPAIDPAPKHTTEATAHTSAPFVDDATGEDAFARRARMSALANPHLYPPQHAHPPSQTRSPQDTTPSQATQASSDHDVKRASALAKIAAMKAKLATTNSASQDLGASPPTTTISSNPTSLPVSPPEDMGLGHTIARAPVRYAVREEVPPQSESQQQTDAETISEAPAKPRKEGFGKRMLQKQGWKEGEGLGVHSEGITTAIFAQAEKRKKLADAEGGGWAVPRNMGKIVGGKRRKIEGADSEPAMSNVIKLPGMLEGLDVKHEIEEKNLQQELGDWFDQNYGKVERVYIWRQDQGGDNEVFIKFTNPISALKAVNPADVLTFANNEVKASFFDASKFDTGDYA